MITQGRQVLDGRRVWHSGRVLYCTNASRLGRLYRRAAWIFASPSFARFPFQVVSIIHAIVAVCIILCLIWERMYVALKGAQLSCLVL